MLGHGDALASNDSLRLNRLGVDNGNVSADDPIGRSNRPRKVREACEIFVYTAALGEPARFARISKV